MQYVIIGNSTAGIAAVEGIRKSDKQGEITIIADEPHHTYSRPLISYYLKGRVTKEGMRYRPNDFYIKNECRLVLNTKVIEIDALKKQVVLEDKTHISFDKLLVATGSSPFVPPFEGLDAVENRFTFMKLDDAEQLSAAIKPDSRVLIVGAGLIGMKCAEGIVGRVADVTVADFAPRILSSILDEEGAEQVQRHMESNGIHFMLSSAVKRFEKQVAVFESGDRVAFDVLVLAVGVRPNTSLLKGIAEIDKGVLVNDMAQTTVKDIYAAGDCAQAWDISSRESRVMGILPNAYIQGERAGLHMAGNEPSQNTAALFPMNAIGFFGLHILTAGQYCGECYFKKDSQNYKKLYYNDNVLKGFMLIGDVQNAGIYTNLIREETPLDSIDFPLVCEKPGLMAFTAADRHSKLGR